MNYIDYVIEYVSTFLNFRKSLSSLAEKVRDFAAKLFLNTGACIDNQADIVEGKKFEVDTSLEPANK